MPGRNVASSSGRGEEIAETSIAGPALTGFGNLLAVAWMGTDSAHHLNVGYLRPGSSRNTVETSASRGLLLLRVDSGLKQQGGRDSHATRTNDLPARFPPRRRAQSSGPTSPAPGAGGGRFIGSSPTSAATAKGSLERRDRDRGADGPAARLLRTMGLAPAGRWSPEKKGGFPRPGGPVNASSRRRWKSRSPSRNGSSRSTPRNPGRSRRSKSKPRAGRTGRRRSSCRRGSSRAGARQSHNHSRDRPAGRSYMPGQSRNDDHADDPGRTRRGPRGHHASRSPAAR
jgi:hypothetical protein